MARARRSGLFRKRFEMSKRKNKPASYWFAWSVVITVPALIIAAVVMMAITDLQRAGVL